MRSTSLLPPALFASFAALTYGCADGPRARSAHHVTAPSTKKTAAIGGGEHDDRGPVTAFCAVLPCPEQLVTRRILKHDERFGSVVCKAGMEASITTSGQLIACKLATAVTVDGLLLAADTFVKFDPEGHVADMELRSTRAFVLADGTKVQCGVGDLHLGRQRLRGCVLGTHLKRNGVRCRVGESVTFHADGALASAMIEDPIATREITFPADSRVTWDGEGHVRGGHLPAPTTVRGLEIGYNVALHPNGALAVIRLHRDATIQGHRFPAFATIGFRANGKLEAAQYVEARGIMIHGEPWTDTRTMTFNEAGAVTSSHLKHYQAPSGPRF